MTLAVRTKIKEFISQMEPGAIFFPTDLFHLGSVSAVTMALSRLTTSEFIQRLAAGIYYYPKVDSLLGQVSPSMEEIAKAVAKREHIIIRPAGATALLKLGLSTQVPMKVVYLTNGNPKKLIIGKGTITFKKTSPKIMAIKGELTFLAVQAIISLGQDGIDERMINVIADKLKEEDPSQIIEDAKLVAGWIRQILFNIANKIIHQ